MVSLYIVNSLLGVEKNLKRFCLASALGAGYALCVLLSKHVMITHFITKMMVLMVMLLIANRICNIKTLLKQLSCYLAITCVFAGLILVIKEQFFQNKAPVYYRSFVLNTWSFKIYVLILVILLVYKYVLVKYIYAYRLAQNTSVLVKAMIGNLQVSIPTILDTGNHLVDPMSQKPVIIVSLTVFKQQLPVEMFDALVTFSEKINVTDQLIADYQAIFQKCKWIPYKSLGTQYKMLLALKPDEISYFYQSREYRGIEALLGFAPEGYFGKKAFKGLMHPAIFQHLSEH